MLALGIGAYYCSTTETVTRVLWAEFTDSDIDFYRGAQTMTRDEEIYAQVRDQVVKKVGDRAQQFVADLDI